MRLEGTLRGNLVPPPSQSKVNYTYDIPERHLSNLFLKKKPHGDRGFTASPDNLLQSITRKFFLMTILNPLC